MSYSDDEFKIGEVEEGDLDLDLDPALDDPIEDDLLGIEGDHTANDGDEEFAGLDGSSY